MNNTYFSVERNGKCIVPALLKLDDGTVAFQDVMNMSYDEIKEYKDIDVLVAAFMDATNAYFQESDDLTVITLIGEDGVFIWGILVGTGDNDDEFKYSFVDWQKDGRSYRYEK
jgi:hypothetical protein